ncbi:MAG: DUF6427 family protein [Cyclobacteriaceae bacterium]
MLLRFFRINDPYRLLGLLIIATAISVPLFVSPSGMLLTEIKNSVLGQAIADGQLMYVQVFDDTPPLAAALFGFVDLIFGRSIVAQHILALLLIIFQASYFAVLLINNKAYAENTYLPCLVFGLLCFFSFDLLSFSPELIASTLLLFALNQLFHEIEFKIQRDDIVLKLGTYLGLATFVIFSYWIFLLVAIIILIVFTRAGFRKIALVVFGFLLPHLLLLTFYFYKSDLPLLWTNFYKSNLTFSGEMLVSAKGIVILASVPLAYFVFSIFMMNREARFTKYQSQLMQVMFLWLITSLVQIFMAQEVSPASFFTFVPPLAYFISHYLLLIRRKWRAELMLWLFVIGTVGFSYYTRAGKVESVDYSKLFSQNEIPQLIGKKVMHLGNGYGIYQGNELGGYFLNWNLSRPILENAERYRNVEIVASCFNEYPPDVVVDEENSLDDFFERIPSLQSNYRREGNLYYRISN